MRFHVTGGTGFIGSHLRDALPDHGHEVFALSRASRGPGILTWDPDRDPPQWPDAEPPEVVVHLAGHPVACRWTAAAMKAIRESRVEGTRRVVRALSNLPRKPSVLICASGIGWYGDRGDEWLTESSERGDGFLADVCRDWEDAAREAGALGIRVVCLRFGLVLSPKGGALARMMLPFRLCLGGHLGHGRQYWSWIALEDLGAAILHAANTPGLSGSVNAVSPRPVTNREFTRVLARALRRPAVLPAPAWALRVALGRMADEMLLASARVRPALLEQTGFQFRFPDLETVLGSWHPR